MESRKRMGVQIAHPFARNTCVFAGVFVRCVVCALVFVSWLLPWSALCSFGVALSCGMLCLVSLGWIVCLFVFCLFHRVSVCPFVV